MPEATRMLLAWLEKKAQPNEIGHQIMDKSSLDQTLLPPSSSKSSETIHFYSNPSGNFAIEKNETVSEILSSKVDALTSKVDELEQNVKEVSDFYANKKNLVPTKANFRGRKEVSYAGLMKGVMDEFGKKLRQLSQLPWAEPFLEPVDVVGLGLHDYHEIIKNPMDFATIRKRMVTNVYKNAREIYADVRLIFTNAMTYNDEKSDVHIMAKSMMDKFEEKWLELLPKVTDAEARQKEEAAQAMKKKQVAQEDSIAKIARDTANELNKLNIQVEELRDMVIQKSRKLTIQDKINIGTGISRLSPENISKALDIIYGKDSKFHSIDELDLDFDDQSPLTIWRLKFFIKRALENEIKNPEIKEETFKRSNVIYEPLTESPEIEEKTLKRSRAIFKAQNKRSEMRGNTKMIYSRLTKVSKKQN